MKGRILIVDDEKAMQLALKGLLSKEGYQVETAGSGEEALPKIDSGSFHVVITDLSMDGVSGMQVLEHARKVDPDLAVVMITARSASTPRACSSTCIPLTPFMLRSVMTT